MLALPERQAYSRLYGKTSALLDALDSAQGLREFVLWEVTVLKELGYGLDLSACAVTAATGELTHVSPRTGRAVCADVAGMYQDRLLSLPAFLRDRAAPAWKDHLLQGLRLTRHFLENRIFTPQQRRIPLMRLELEQRLIAA
jgi:DNA repair protein RecO (recombination protein O)